MSDRTRQNNKRADRKVESNDSPGIPDRGETSEVPGLSSGLYRSKLSVKGLFHLLHSLFGFPKIYVTLAL